MKKAIYLLLIALCVLCIMACKQEPAHEHTWDEGEITTPATCTKDGVKTYKCTGCGETKTEAAAATGHSWDEGTDNGNGKIVYECTVCDEQRSEYKTYATGARGPANGFVFYDVDADNEKGNADGLKSSECGWRYLEAAPADLEDYYMFGFYRKTDEGENLFVNGKTVYSAADCTGTAVGTGKANTDKLVAAMGSSAYSSSLTGMEKVTPGAKACADHTVGDFDDWFLPSKDELNLMYTRLKSSGLGNFHVNDTYLSSSERETNSQRSWIQIFKTGTQDAYGRSLAYSVRPVRTF